MKTAQNIFLVGLMGSGKTTIGKILSQRLLMDFYDSDMVIEQRTGATASLIFDVEGEKGFRIREKQVIQELSNLQGIVLATGGGAIIDQQNRENLTKNGKVIYLHCELQELIVRTSHDGNRPLLKDQNIAEVLSTLDQQRDSLYREIADWVVESGHQKTFMLVDQIVEIINQH